MGASPDDLVDALRRRDRAPNLADARPRLFDAGDDAQRRELVALLGTPHVRYVHDTVEDDLAELIAAREPWRRLAPEQARGWARERIGDGVRYGAWAYYPWSGRLVHALPVDELRELRTDRNRYKITRAEQARLHGARIGVVGLSVGNAAALTCVREGIGTRFRLADFDALALSNLNRLRAGLHDLATNKAVLAAREMFELDPYLDIELFDRGITRDNLDAFLVGLDLLVEECDDLFVKVRIREHARRHRVPVVMDTSDRGMLDIERFDLEPARPVLHGLLGDVDAERLAGLETRDKAPYVLAILGRDRMSARMAASLPEVKETIASWPQLASSVALGGAIVADVARRILLGTHTASGRYHVDLEAIVRDGAAELATPVVVRAVELAPEALAPPQLPREPAPEEARRLTPDTVRFLVAHAALAPSAHNAQPWRFRFAGGRLHCEHDPAHDLPMLDFERGATWAAFGAALENLTLAAGAVGLAVAAELFPAPGVVVSAAFAPAPVARDPLFAWIARRVTNRRLGRRQPLGDAAARLAAAIAPVAGTDLALATDPAALDELAALVGACDRVTTFDAAMHRETMAGIRWNRDEVERHRDGIDIATLELAPADRAGFELLSSWPVAATLAELGGGRALEDGARRAIASASAVGLVTAAGVDRASYLAGGRAMQRAWLASAAEGLAVQPMTSLPYLLARLERGGGAGLEVRARGGLAGLRTRFAQIFPVEPDRAEVLLFRVGRADPPTARSLRRRLDDLLVLA